MGVWIETCKSCIYETDNRVTPCVGVWIETITDLIKQLDELVTPCVGVWIETQFCTQIQPIFESHPAWVCGLKQLNVGNYTEASDVTPCVGVWIETKRV